MTAQPLPIAQLYIDEARALLPDPPESSKPRRILTDAHSMGDHSLCGPDCEERADG